MGDSVQRARQWQGRPPRPRGHPDGTSVFVTGNTEGVICANYATVAYDASPGAEQWVTGPNRGRAGRFGLP